MQSEIYEYFLPAAIKSDILICETEKEAKIAADAASLAGCECFILPDFRAEFGDDLRSYFDEFVQISKVLSDFYKSNSQKKLIVAPIHTILHKLPAKKHLKTLNLGFADKINLSELKSELVCFGYSVVDIVESPAEVSFRGEIIDIFPVNSEFAYRILLDDTEIESIRRFNPTSQLSDKTELESVEISPFLASLSEDEFENLNEKIENFDSSALVKDMNSLGFWLIDDFCDYLSEFRAICARDLSNLDFDDEKKAKISALEILPQAIEFRDLDSTLSDEFVRFHKNKKIRVLARNSAIFESLNLTPSPNVIFEISPLIVNIASENLVIISLNKFKKKRKTKRSSIVIDELQNGDFVVHSEYGIGKFVGLELARVLGVQKEFVAILYQNDDKLLLPVENLNMIDRYVSSGETAVLDRLGKGNFLKIKERVREKLFAIASKIVSLAAERELVDGKKMKENPPEYANLLTSSGFEYTDDQNRAISEIFADLRSGRVMDRLLSGDVGFGKTEVALNAIFMVWNSGYQSLFFVPTTLLSSQHYKTLKERLSPFGIPIFRLDRFTSAREKAELKAKLLSGEPLVCVGTHALLSLEAPNLGLIVIDEEHKFGVKQKEKLKEISKNSHLLSMSATPIPRSLNMALSTIKSYSVLLTPPSERVGTKTIVKEWDEKVIKEAIMRELRRGGQVFFVHNHIATIEETKREILGILPNLKILVLHSKIDQKTTEDEMMKFIEKKYDLLLCTSIVESGLHLPNANTIIIDNSDRFGIADLHQLRGRVGRSEKQGFCYFLINDREKLTSDSLKRLLALESNSFLGSGSVLARHDLEIRGGGNLLGTAQSGHIEAIGYSLYLKMLEDEINMLLNRKTAALENVDLKLNVTAFLNADFIREDRLRLELYRRLAKCAEVSEVYEIASEIEDRFGKLDTYTAQFIQVILIKVLARKQNYKTITNFEMNINLIKNNGEKVLLKARSKDDDDVLAEILAFLRKGEK